MNTDVVINSPTLTAEQKSATYQWLDCQSLSPIPGETGQSFTASENGEYAVIIQFNSCTDTSFCFFITGVDVQEPSELKMTVYPNPTEGTIRIELGAKYDEVELSLLDLQGHRLDVITRKDTSSIIYKIEGPAGTYYLQIKTPAGITTRKILKL